MGTVALSPRVNLEQSKKQAKELLESFKAGDPETLDRIRWNHPRFRGLTDSEIRTRKFVLADAQLVIARLHYFDSWPKLLRHIETVTRNDPHVMRFETAADAIISGDIATLGALLLAHPELIRQRSTRGHHAPLLHYITANGVENYRQLSPKNAVEVGTLLLDSGAEVDATSEAYGGGSTALGLVTTSTPPRRAGVQLPLMNLLLDRGAAIDGVTPGASSVMAALANTCPEAAAALAERGARVDDIIAAAGIGRLDLVRHFAKGATQEQRDNAFVMAARYGHHEIVEYLLDAGVDIAASDGMTALHEAAGHGHLSLVDLLIERGAPLEKRNVYGGTVLASTLWFAYHHEPLGSERIDYSGVIDKLIDAGARVDAYPRMREHIDEVFRRAGKRPPWRRD